MDGNIFGDNVKIITFGESHGAAQGAVILGLSPNLEISLTDIAKELARRKPGQSKITTQRKEADEFEVLSGIFEGKTLGTPICLIVRNLDQRSKDYSEVATKFRPGHADYSYFLKYGIFDYRGGGRSSGRETVTRVMTGAIARQILEKLGTRIIAHTAQIGNIRAKTFDPEVIESNMVRCADSLAAQKMVSAIEAAQSSGDSLGGIIEARITNPPPGLGDPVFGKLDAELSRALLSIGSVKGIEFGDGFAAAHMKGSEFNDPISPEGLTTNHAGGILGGISTGDPIVLRIVVKPTSSISRDQQTIDRAGKAQTIHIHGRHDPCICPRIVPVVEAMIALVLLDRYHYQLVLQSTQNLSTQKLPLAQLRQRVDFIDAQLLALLADRQYWVRQIKNEKLRRLGKKVLAPRDIADPKREKFQLNRIKKISKDLALNPQDARNVFKSIFKLSKNAQAH